MGYRIDRNLNRREIKNKKLRNRSLLAAIVFTLSIISNSIMPKTLLVAANQNKRYEVEVVNVGDNVKSEDEVFELYKKAEKDDKGNIDVTLEVKVNKDKLPLIGQESMEDSTEEDQVEPAIEYAKLKKITLNEYIKEGFQIINDTVKIESITGENAVQLKLDELKTNKQLNQNIENQLNLTLNDVTADLIKINYTIALTSTINAVDNTSLIKDDTETEKSELKYYLSNETEKTVKLPEISINIKEVIIELETEEPPTKGNTTAEETITTEEVIESSSLDEENVADEIDNVEQEISSDVENEETFGNNETDYTGITGIYKTLPVEWSRTPEPGNQGSSYINIKNERNYYSSSNNSYIINDKNNINTEFNPGRVIVAPTTMYDGVEMKKGTFDYNTITRILNPTQKNNVWNSNNGNGATWNHYTADNSSKYDSWRLFRGEFTTNDLENKRYYIGILDSQGEPSLIVPINDHMVVLVDGKPIGVNYTTQNQTTIGKKNFSLRFNGEIYNPTFTRAYRKGSGTCSDQNHYNQSTHTDGWHIHLGDIINDNEQGILGDITSYLDSSKSTHTVEILFGDNEGIGGASKLQVFEIDASIDVKKRAYTLSENSNGSTTEVQITNSINKGTDIYYELEMTNESSFAADSVVFQDDLLNIKIDSTGIYKKSSNGEWNKTSESLDGLSITRGNVTKEKLEALTLLKDVPAGVTITIKDTKNLKYETKYRTEESFDVENTVMVTGNFLNGKIPVVKSATSTVNIKETIDTNSITITKSVYEINGNETTSTSIKPDDNVSFKFTITNTNDFTVANLTISDDLSGKYEKPTWTFKKLNSQGNLEDFDENSFTIGPNETIVVIASGWTVPEPYTKLERGAVEIWDYTVTNTVTLSKGSWSKSASVNLEIQPPSLRIKKVVDLSDYTDLVNDRTFTIMVKGNDGTQYNIEAEKDIEYTLNNLKYGVTYTISEIVPMNYSLVSVSGDNVSYSTTTLTGSNNNPLVTVTNKKVNDSFWTSENKVINKFKYNYNKGLEFIESIFNFNSEEE